MKNQDAIKERYLRDPLPIRLGGLAANLARIESFSNHPASREAVNDLVEESKYFIEWTALEAELEVQAELAEIQRQLARWQYRWDQLWADTAERAAMAKQAGAWSLQILERSGLLAR